MYLIAKGEVKINIASNSNSEDSKDKKRKPKTLRPGKYFGEIALVFDCVCTATVTATKYCTLAKMDK